MKKKYPFLLFIAALMLSFSTASAQFNPRSNVVALDSKVDTLKVDVDKTSEMLNFKIYNDAYDKYLRELQSKHRNTFQFRTGLKITQASFSNWAPGGNNYFSGRATVNAQHVYTAPTFNIKTVFDAAYSILSTDGKTRKSEDYFNLTSTSSWRISQHWEFSASGILSSQFTNSYKAPEDTLRTSSFFAPGYLTIAPGIKYNNTKKTLEIFFAPTSGNLVMVMDKEIADRGTFGEKGKQFNPKFINYFRLIYSEKFLQNKLSVNAKLESFWGYTGRPRIVSENKLDFQISKLLSTNFYLMAIYDDKIATPDSKKGKENYLQINQSLGFGIEYRFNTRTYPAPPEAPRKKARRL